MKPFACPDEIYRFLISIRGPDGDGETDLIALFTLALIEEERIAWSSHRSEQNLPFPNEAEIRAWYESKPEKYFMGKLRHAEQWFSGFARAYLKDEIEADRERAVREAVAGLRTTIAASQTVITGHIDSRTQRKGWDVNIASGLVANFIFAFIVAVLFFVAANRLSLGDIISDIAKGRIEQGR